MVKTVMLLVLVATAPALSANAQTKAAGTANPATAVSPAHPAPPAPSPAPVPTAGAATNQFSTEQSAKAHCPGDTVVWANLGGSKAYHTSSDRYYGKTRHGAYMCQKEAEQAGFHAPGRGATRTGAKTSPAK